MRIWKDLDLDEIIGKFRREADSFDLAMGVCRYAIHGRPAIQNTPPSLDCTQRFLLIARGLVCNPTKLYFELIKIGHLIEGKDPSELLVHRIEEDTKHLSSVDKVLANMHNSIKGVFSVLLRDAQDGSVYLLTKNLMEYIGISEGEPGKLIISSEPDVIARHNLQLYAIADGLIKISDGKINVISGELIKPQIRLGKIPGGFDYHMEREISEIPLVLAAQKYAQPPEYLAIAARLIKSSEKLFVIGSGSSFNSALYGGYIISELLEIQHIVQNAVEFIYFYLQKVNPGDVVIANSQSGMTTDVMRAVTQSRMRGAIIIGLINRLGTPLMFASNVYLHIAAGIEVAVPATKTFIAQLATFARLTIELLDESKSVKKELEDQLENLPSLAAKTMVACSAVVDDFASRVFKFNNAFVLGRAANYPIALEGALKLKEVAQIHAEGLDSGEFRHGTKTLMEYRYPVIFLMPQDPEAREDTYELMNEIKDFASEILVITDEEDTLGSKFAKHIVRVPRIHDLLEPILYTLPLQRLALKLGMLRGKTIDYPPKLTKYVATMQKEH
ncbi:MAG: SIS domain-containing protein [Candidatus Korarchaeota archaeon]